LLFVRAKEFIVSFYIIFFVKSTMKRATLSAMFLILLSASFSTPCRMFVGAEEALWEEETIARRDLVINLGDGVTTDAQLTLPSVGEGPFPGVLLVHGSGNTDMDEYLPPLVTGTEEPSRPFLQIAEYLSERGIAVLRYNKRGIGLNGTILDEGVVTDMTYQQLQQDAEKALEVLLQQPEVNVDDITILGHSEGTWMAPRIAIKDARVKKIVLMSAAAHNLYNILYFQIVEQGIRQFEEIDSNHDGLLSIQEVYVLPSIMTDQLIENSTGEWLWIPGIDPNGDGYISLSEERLPLWTQTFEYLTTAEYPGSIWLQSHFTLDNNLDIIDDVSASVLILQGEGDTQTPVSEAFLLEQSLVEVGHPDHTLITYPGLGHTFYPREGLLQWLGPIQDYVLSDLADWLKDPARNTRYLELQFETALDTITELRGQLEGERARISGLEDQNEVLQSQLGDLNSELDRQTGELGNLIEGLQSESASMKNTLSELENRNDVLQSTLDSYRNLIYIALGVALLAVAGAAVLIFQRRQI
jgi:pimeloyl-ACP methyl ester carboxylesterase